MKKEAMRLSFPRVSEPFEAALVEVKAFPDHEEASSFIRSELLPWLRGLRHEHNLHLAVWIQGENLHEGNAADLVREHGAYWLPDTGLGVWPDREPPRLWIAEDFQDLDPGQKPRPLMYTVFHVSGGPEACEHALSTLAGSGTLMCALLEKTPDKYHEKATAQFLPAIRDEALRGHPFYVPLLAARSCENAAMSSWLDGVLVYARESTEDNGILVLSRINHALRALLPHQE
jgi:hypothetical protein